MIAIYAIAKFLAYSAWCHLGLRLADPPSATVFLSRRFGAIRWLIGLVVGIGVFVAIGSVDPADAYRTYFVVYSPVVRSDLVSPEDSRADCASANAPADRA